MHLQISLEGEGVIKIIRDIGIEDTSGQSTSEDYHEAQWWFENRCWLKKKEAFLNSEDLWKIWRISLKLAKIYKWRNKRILWARRAECLSETGSICIQVTTHSILIPPPSLTATISVSRNHLHHHLRPQRTSGNQEGMRDATVFDKYEPKALWAKHDKRLSEGNNEKRES